MILVSLDWFMGEFQPEPPMIFMEKKHDWFPADFLLNSTNPMNGSLWWINYQTWWFNTAQEKYLKEASLELAKATSAIWV